MKPLISYHSQVCLPLCTAIEKLLNTDKKKLLIAIDGPCASGKSTLAEALQRQFVCNLFHMDDFFLPPERKTVERLAEPGGNVDRERFLAEVLLPLQNADPFCYGIYSCQTGKTTPSPIVFPERLNIVEGVYSLHPAYSHLYDFKICLTVSPDLQKQRIEQRNGSEKLQQFLTQWIPLENQYFSAFDIMSQCDLRLELK